MDIADGLYCNRHIVNVLVSLKYIRDVSPGCYLCAVLKDSTKVDLTMKLST